MGYRKVLPIAVALSLIIAPLAVTYYLVVFLPNKLALEEADRILAEQAEKKKQQAASECAEVAQNSVGAGFVLSRITNSSPKDMYDLSYTNCLHNKGY